MPQVDLDSSPKRQETVQDIEARLRDQLTRIFILQPGLAQIAGAIAWWMQWRLSKTTEESIGTSGNLDFIQGQRDALKDIILQFQTWAQESSGE